jgi:hypothetical protein
MYVVTSFDCVTLFADKEELMRSESKKTIELLNELVACGFPDSAFSLLHHMPKETIQSHIDHCSKHESIEGENVRVPQRLEIVRGAYQGGQFTSRSPLFFQHLALLARVEVPMEH